MFADMPIQHNGELYPPSQTVPWGSPPAPITARARPSIPRLGAERHPRRIGREDVVMFSYLDDEIDLADAREQRRAAMAAMEAAEDRNVWEGAFTLAELLEGDRRFVGGA